MSHWRYYILSIFLSLWAVAAPALAHDFGAMKLTLTIDSQSASITIDALIDGQHLPRSQNPFTSLGGSQPPDQFRTAFLQSFQLRFDDAHSATSAPLILDSWELRPDQTEIHALLHALIPTQAHSFTLCHTQPIGQYYVRVLNAPDDLNPQTFWLKPDETTDPISLPSPVAPTSTTQSSLSLTTTIPLYLKLGYTHILPEGLDHILFVLGLFFLAMQWRPILWQTAAFTIAHSITLGLSMLGVFSLPSSIVEPAIALSIVYVAVENLTTTKFHWRRIAVVFAFGLIHGLGFAGVLNEIGLPRSQFLPALLSFNIGVELGQLTVVAGAFLAVGLWFSRKSWYRPLIASPCSLAIAATGLFWTIQRIAF